MPGQKRGLGNLYDPSSPGTSPDASPKRARLRSPSPPPPPPPPPPIKGLYIPKDRSGYKKYFTKNFRDNHLVVDREYMIRKKNLKEKAKNVQVRRKMLEPHIPASTTLGLMHSQMKELKHYLKGPDNQEKLRNGEIISVPYTGKRAITIGIGEDPDRERIKKRPEFLHLKASKSQRALNAKGKIRVGHYIGID